MQRHEYTGPVALRAMQSLSSRLFPDTGYRHIGDLTWAWCLALDREDENPTAVWTDGDENRDANTDKNRDERTDKNGDENGEAPAAGPSVPHRPLAWAWLELPGSLQFQVDPAYPGLADEVLAWAAGRAAGGALSVEVAETEPHLMAALERHGHTRTDGGPFMVGLGRSLADLPAAPRLPDGYRIRAQRSRAEVAGRAAAHRAAFGSTRVTTERHARMRETWPYRAEFDLVVVSPAGEVAAYCQGWYDAALGIGVFEPVGTHPEHRRRGLARAVCLAVLRAFAEAGGRRAVVYCRGDAAYPAPKRLYESLGFTAYTRTHTYV
ncbi:GNAT family N-acetyltransferase [Streptomyces sp. NPDC048637]|uniref:GNAT family N-acetyltransferase n=1 Tax=Streptomyces sp. NPDC048637 TaxID=3155636 RepID=UPI00341B42F9